MKRLLFILLLLPLFAYSQSEKNYRSIIVDSLKGLTGSVVDAKDNVIFEAGLDIDDSQDIGFLSGASTGSLILGGALAGNRTWSIPGFTGTISLGTGTANSIASWSAVNTAGDGTWEFSGNTILPTTDLTNIGITATNRVGSLFIGGTVEYATNLNFVEGTGGVQTMRMDASSNVKIGTGAPSYRLDVTGTTSSTDIRTGATGNAVHWATIKIFNDSTLALDGSVVGLLPAGYIIENIIFKETAASNITGFDIGFTAGGQEVVANGTINASDEGSFTILQRVDDFDAADEIFFDATNWSTGNLIIYIKMSRIF